MGECMSEKGWDVITGYDSNRISTPEGQEDAQRRDFEACYHENGLDRPGPPVNEELAKSEYAAQVRYRDCLIQHGVDAPGLPSYEKYEDDLLVQGFIYDLSGEIGMGAEDPLRITFKDPMNTWGNNG